MNPALYSIYYFLEENLKPERFATHEWKLLEFNINQNPIECRSILFEEDADIYAFSVYIWNLEFIDKLLDYLKKTRPNAKYIAGGPEVQYDVANEYKRQTAWDYVMQGDGELEFLNLFNRDVDHVLAKKGKENLTTVGVQAPLRLPPEFLPFYYPKIEDRLANKIVHYESSRGCPYRCSYCVSSVEGNPQFKPIEQVFRELDYFIEKEYEIVKFLDRSFNFPSSRAILIWQYLIQAAETLGIEKMPRFHFELESSLLDDESVELLTHAPKDLFQFEIGIQSIHQKTLQLVNRKPLTISQIHSIQKLLVAGKQNIHLDLIAGLPEESLKMLEESYNFLWQLKPDMLQLGHLKLLRGTPLLEDALARGYIYNPNPPYEVYQSDGMMPADFILANQVAEMTERYMDQGILKNTFRYYVEKKKLSAFRFLGALAQVYDRWRGPSLRFLGKDEQYFVFIDYIYKEDPEMLGSIMGPFLTEFMENRKPGSLGLEKVVQKLVFSGKIEEKLSHLIMKESIDD